MGIFQFGPTREEYLEHMRSLRKYSILGQMMKHHEWEVQAARRRAIDKTKFVCYTIISAVGLTFLIRFLFGCYKLYNFDNLNFKLVYDAVNNPDQIEIAIKSQKNGPISFEIEDLEFDVSANSAKEKNIEMFRFRMNEKIKISRGKPIDSVNNISLLEIKNAEKIFSLMLTTESVEVCADFEFKIWFFSKKMKRTKKIEFEKNSNKQKYKLLSVKPDNNILTFEMCLLKDFFPEQYELTIPPLEFNGTFGNSNFILKTSKISPERKDQNFETTFEFGSDFPGHEILHYIYCKSSNPKDEIAVPCAKISLNDSNLGILYKMFENSILPMEHLFSSSNPVKYPLNDLNISFDNTKNEILINKTLADGAFSFIFDYLAFLDFEVTLNNQQNVQLRLESCEKGQKMKIFVQKFFDINEFSIPNDYKFKLQLGKKNTVLRDICKGFSIEFDSENGVSFQFGQKLCKNIKRPSPYLRKEYEFDHQITVQDNLSIQGETALKVAPSALSNKITHKISFKDINLHFISDLVECTVDCCSAVLVFYEDEPFILEKLTLLFKLIYAKEMPNISNIQDVPTENFMKDFKFQGKYLIQDFIDRNFITTSGPSKFLTLFSKLTQIELKAFENNKTYVNFKKSSDEIIRKGSISALHHFSLHTFVAFTIKSNFEGRLENFYIFYDTTQPRTKKLCFGIEVFADGNCFFNQNTTELVFYKSIYDLARADSYIILPGISNMYTPLDRLIANLLNLKSIKKSTIPSNCSKAASNSMTNSMQKEPLFDNLVPQSEIITFKLDLENTNRLEGLTVRVNYTGKYFFEKFCVIDKNFVEGTICSGSETTDFIMQKLKATARIAKTKGQFTPNEDVFGKMRGYCEKIPFVAFFRQLYNGPTYLKRNFFRFFHPSSYYHYFRGHFWQSKSKEVNQEEVSETKFNDESTKKSNEKAKTAEQKPIIKYSEMNELLIDYDQKEIKIIFKTSKSNESYLEVVKRLIFMGDSCNSVKWDLNVEKVFKTQNSRKKYEKLLIDIFCPSESSNLGDSGSDETKVAMRFDVQYSALQKFVIHQLVENYLPENFKLSALIKNWMYKKIFQLKMFSHFSFLLTEIENSYLKEQLEDEEVPENLKPCIPILLPIPDHLYVTFPKDVEFLIKTTNFSFQIKPFIVNSTRKIFLAIYKFTAEKDGTVQDLNLYQILNISELGSQLEKVLILPEKIQIFSRSKSNKEDTI